MAKSTKSLHLEDSLWDEIDKVKDEFNTSRSSALEYILIERRTLLNIINSSDLTKKVSEQTKDNNNDITTKVDKNVVSKFGSNDVMQD